MTIGAPSTPPAPVRQARTIVLAQAAVCGSLAAVVLALTVATFTQRTSPDGKTLVDVSGPLALEALAVVSALAVALTSRRLGTGSRVARKVLIVLESAIAVTGLVLTAAIVRHSPGGGVALGLAVAGPAAIALVALTTGDCARWCRRAR